MPLCSGIRVSDVRSCLVHGFVGSDDLDGHLGDGAVSVLSVPVTCPQHAGEDPAPMRRKHLVPVVDDLAHLRRSEQGLLRASRFRRASALGKTLNPKKNLNPKIAPVRRKHLVRSLMTLPAWCRRMCVLWERVFHHDDLDHEAATQHVFAPRVGFLQISPKQRGMSPSWTLHVLRKPIAPLL